MVLMTIGTASVIGMKTRTSSSGMPGLVLIVLMAWAPGGVAQDDASRPGTPGQAALSAPAAGPGFHEKTAVLAIPSAATNAVFGQTLSKDGQPPLRPPLSPWTTEVVKLGKAGVEDSVIYSYIDNTPGTFNLDADQIIHLNDLGISSDVLTAMLQHDSDLRSGLQPVPASTVPGSSSTMQITFVAASDASSGTTQPPASQPEASLLAGSEASNPPGDNAPEPDFHLVPAVASRAVYRMPDPIGSDRALAPPQTGQGFAPRATVYPVREPYPVQITDPIFVIHAAGRTPNVVVIRFMN
jgi:hypothetical protein